MPDADVLAVAAREVREFAKVGLREDSPSRRLQLLERAPTLRGLQPVQAAGRDSRAQFEYLVQAIIDAIDELGRTVTTISVTSYRPLTSEGNREAQALRALFGLTDRTRITTWRVRQEAAAICLSVSWDHFRHDIQEPLLRSLAERILQAAFNAEFPSSGLISLTSGLSAFATQKDIENSVIDYIKQVRPQSAAMLELSTSTEGPILRALRDVGAHIRLLVANPERFFSEWQGPRIHKSLGSLLSNDFDDYDALDLRLFSAPPSLRGPPLARLLRWAGSHIEITNVLTCQIQQTTRFGDTTTQLSPEAPPKEVELYSRYGLRESSNVCGHTARLVIRLSPHESCGLRIKALFSVYGPRRHEVDTTLVAKGCWRPKKETCTVIYDDAPCRSRQDQEGTPFYGATRDRPRPLLFTPDLEPHR